MTDQQFDDAMKIGGELASHIAYRDMTDISSGFQSLTAAFEYSKSMIISEDVRAEGLADIAMINAFQQMVDPGATVREGDVALQQSATALLERMKPEFLMQQIQEGAKLPADFKASMHDLAGRIYTARRADYMETVGKRYGALARRRGLSLADIGGQFQALEPSYARPVARP